MQRIEEIEALLDAGNRLLVLETGDVDGALKWFEDLDRSTGRACYRWAERQGLRRLSADHIPIPETVRLTDALDYIQDRRQFGIFLIPDLGVGLRDTDVLNRMLMHAQFPEDPARVIIIYGNHPTLPVRLAPLAERITHQRFD